MRSVRLINVQLKEAREIKANSIVLQRKLADSKYALLRHESTILGQQDEIFKKDSIIRAKNVKIKQQDWEWIRAENRYERAEKKAYKFKRFFIGSTILSAAGIIILLLL